MALNHRFSARVFSRAFAFVAIALAAFALATPVAAQDDEEEVSRVIAVQVYAEVHGSEDPILYGVAPENEPVEVSPGEHLRLTLVGTGLVGGKGEEVEIPAAFNIAAGRGVQITGRGDNWIDVAISPGASGNAGEIGYRVGDDYEMRRELTSGRIILEVVDEE
ncbi:MAG TPA: hypothetical protein VGS22_05350 [Thermoanaerobaculia bacterium]|jgi:hypothetical protein|nr:hypothetical protein [Thermoanaerobaculia bacterium]